MAPSLVWVPRKPFNALPNGNNQGPGKIIKIILLRIQTYHLRGVERLWRGLKRVIIDEEKILRVSGSIGSEAGVLSIGSGGGIDQISIVATYVNRHKRERDIWEIADSLREKISKIKYIKSVEVSPYGSTAIASIRANIDAKRQ